MIISAQRIFLVIVLSIGAATTQADDFILSYWCGPPVAEDINKRYAEVAECNFNYAMLACSGSSSNQAVLEACKKNKLKYVVHDSRILSYGPENPAFKTNLDAIISDYTKHTALGGYFLADEPGVDSFPLLGAVNQYLLEHDPKRLPFINLLPNHAPDWALGGPYEQHVEKFLTSVKPRLLCFDHYALMVDNTVRPIYFENLEIIRRQGLKHDVPFGFIFQVTPHGPYRDPSEDDLRWQVNTALAYGVKALFHFTYWSPTNDPSFLTSNAIIDTKGNRSPHYEQARCINAAVKAWAPTLMKLKSTEIYHTGTLPKATRGLPKDAVVQIKTVGEFLVGTFKHEDGSDWLMIMNRALHKPAETTVRFEKSIKRLRELSDKNGKLFGVKIRGNEFTFSLPAGGAKLFKLSR